MFMTREQEASVVTCGHPGVSISVILADVFLPIKAQRNQKHNEKSMLQVKRIDSDNTVLIG